MEHNLLKIDEFLQVDLGCPEVWLRGERVDLTPLEWRLLCHMARRRGRVVTREELRKAAWDGSPPRGWKNLLKGYIRRLRHKIEDDPGSPRYILTRWGIGYRFMEPRSPDEVMAASGFPHWQGMGEGDTQE
jgi:DNA-binding response OmpR family regulator